MKFNHEAEHIAESIGYTNDEFQGLLNRMSESLDQVAPGETRCSFSEVVEHLANDGFTRDEMIILFCWATKG